jgi:hypothetical protein
MQACGEIVFCSSSACLLVCRFECWPRVDLMTHFGAKTQEFKKAGLEPGFRYEATGSREDGGLLFETVRWVLGKNPKQLTAGSRTP